MMQPKDMNMNTKLRVNKIINKIKFLLYLQGSQNPKYKTTLCKKYSTPQGCPYGTKCQFAHGAQELRLYSGQGMPQNALSLNKSQNSALNYKIVKCKNYEKDGTCKYGAHCTFAHGDEELRNKADNLYQFNPSMPLMLPMILPAGMDMNQMQQFMANGQLMMMGNMNPNMGQVPGNELQNNEEK